MGFIIKAFLSSEYPMKSAFTSPGKFESAFSLVTLPD